MIMLAVINIILAVATIGLVILAILQLKATQNQLKTNSKNIAFGAFRDSMESLESDQARNDRDYIYTLVKDKSKTWDDIPKLLNEIGESRKLQIERTVNSFDRAGYFILKGYVQEEEPTEWIWEISINLWTILNPFIQWARNQYGRQKYGVYFEQLATEAAKHLNSKDNKSIT